MSVCVLWKLLSVWSVLASLAVAEEEYESDDYENYGSLQNFSQLCTNFNPNYLGVSLYLRNEDGVMVHNTSEYIDSSSQSLEEEIAALTDVVGVPLPLNVSCMVDMRNHLTCSWDTRRILEHEYSISYLLCSETYQVLLENMEERVHAPHYHTVIDNQTDEVILQLNMSTPNLWYIQTHKWSIHNIEKLDPPRILNATRHSAELHLEWEMAKSHSRTTNNICFVYELRINDEVITIKESLSHTMQNVDLAQSYRVQMRVKKSNYCRETRFWSEWTPIIDLDPTVAALSDFHIRVIIAIALGLPMILLAIVLACKFQKVFDKIFPPIPGPSIKIKGLLDKDITPQVHNSSNLRVQASWTRTSHLVYMATALVCLTYTAAPQQISS